MRALTLELRAWRAIQHYHEAIHDEQAMATYAALRLWVDSWRPSSVS